MEATFLMSSELSILISKNARVTCYVEYQILMSSIPMEIQLLIPSLTSSYPEEDNILILSFLKMFSCRFFPVLISCYLHLGLCCFQIEVTFSFFQLQSIEMDCLKTMNYDFASNIIFILYC